MSRDKIGRTVLSCLLHVHFLDGVQFSSSFSSSSSSSLVARRRRNVRALLRDGETWLGFPAQAAGQGQGPSSAGLRGAYLNATLSTLQRTFDEARDLGFDIRCLRACA